MLAGSLQSEIVGNPTLPKPILRDIDAQPPCWVFFWLVAIATVEGLSMANNQEGIVEVVGASVATKGMWAGAGTGLAGFLSQANWIGIIGVALAALGFVVNTYFQVRKDRREAAESEARIQALKDQCRT